MKKVSTGQAVAETEGVDDTSVAWDSIEFVDYKSRKVNVAYLRLFLP